MKNTVMNCQGKCPKCKSDNVEYFGSDLDGDCMYYKCECNECGTQFKEWYSVLYDCSIYEDIDILQSVKDRLDNMNSDGSCDI